MKTSRSAHMLYNTTSLNLSNSFAKILWNYDVSTLPDARKLATFIHKNTSCEVKYSAKPSDTARRKTTTCTTCRTSCPLNSANHRPHFEINEQLIVFLPNWAYCLLASWEKTAGVYSWQIIGLDLWKWFLQLSRTFLLCLYKLNIFHG